MTLEEEIFLKQLHAAIMANTPREMCPPEGNIFLELMPTVFALKEKYNVSVYEIILDEDFEKEHAIEKKKMTVTVGRCFQVPKDHEVHYIAPFGVLTWVVNKKGKVYESASMDRMVYEGTYFYDGKHIVSMPNPHMSNVYCTLAKKCLKKKLVDEAEVYIEAALVVDENNQCARTLHDEIVATKS